MGENGRGDALTLGADRQVVIESRHRQSGTAGMQARLGTVNRRHQLRQNLINRLALTQAPAHALQAAGKDGAIASRARRQALAQGNKQFFHGKVQQSV